MMLRSAVEFTKRVALDRRGNGYVYGGTWDPFNLGVGADCSGLVTDVCSGATLGPKMVWSRQGISTETWRTQPDRMRTLFGAIRAPSPAAIPRDAAVKVALHHGGGGPQSHMWCEIDGWRIESNGSRGHVMFDDARRIDDGYANDWFYIPGPIIDDTTVRQAMGYPRGLDYAGGRPAGTAIRAAGYTFVCRYLSDGGRSLPGKQLLPAEAADLRANGIAIVSNWETTASRMLGGADAGRADAIAARAQVVACGGPADGVIYFSADWDATPAQQQAINDYLAAAGQVLGGAQHVGIYGGYWPLHRALDAGVATWAWQTEAWSGGNVDARVNIVQRNGLGYANVGGVQCDINEAHTDNIGAWGVGSAPATTAPAPAPTRQFPKDYSDRELLEYIAEQLGPGRDEWGADGDLGRNDKGQRRTVRAGLAALARKAGA